MAPHAQQACATGKHGVPRERHQPPRGHHGGACLASRVPLHMPQRHAVTQLPLIKGAKDIYSPGALHGITATHQDRVNADLLAFLRS